MNSSWTASFEILDVTAFILGDGSPIALDGYVMTANSKKEPEVIITQPNVPLTEFLPDPEPEDEVILVEDDNSSLMIFILLVHGFFIR